MRVVSVTAQTGQSEAIHSPEACAASSSRSHPSTISCRRTLRSVAHRAGLSKGAVWSAEKPDFNRNRSYGVDIVGHRCGRVHRIECAGEPQRGRPRDIAVNDILGSDGKWRNLSNRQIADFVPPAELLRWLDGRKLEAIVHMGTISSTTATDGDAVTENNFRLSLRLLDWRAATYLDRADRYR